MRLNSGIYYYLLLYKCVRLTQIHLRFYPVWQVIYVGQEEDWSKERALRDAWCNYHFLRTIPFKDNSLWPAI